MEVLHFDWALLDRVMQWLVIPAAIVAWQYARGLNARQSVLEKQLGETQSEIKRILTILEERQKRRDEDRTEVAEAVRELRGAIQSLHNDIKSLGSRT